MQLFYDWARHLKSFHDIKCVCFCRTYFGKPDNASDLRGIGLPMWQIMSIQGQSGNLQSAKHYDLNDKRITNNETNDPPNVLCSTQYV